MKTENMSTLKITAETINIRMDAMLPACAIESKIREAVERAQEESEPQKLKLSIKADIEVHPDETIEFTTWSEVSQTKKDVSEKVGEMFDLRQTTLKFGGNE